MICVSIYYMLYYFSRYNVLYICIPMAHADIIMDKVFFKKKLTSMGFTKFGVIYTLNIGMFTN